jgi:hypothetical protein
MVPLWREFFMRLNKSQKLGIVERHLKEGIPIHGLSKGLGYDAAKIKYACALCRRYGGEALFIDLLAPALPPEDAGWGPLWWGPYEVIY